MSSLAILRAPGMPRMLGLSLLARMPLGVIGLLLLLQVRHLGLSYAVGGLATAAFTLGMAIGSPVMGRLIGRYGQPRVLHASGICAAAALVAFANVPAGLPGLLVGLTTVIGFAQPPVSACLRAILAQHLDRRDRDAIFAIDLSLQSVVLVVAPPALVWVATIASPGLSLELTGLLLVVATSAFAFGPETRALHGSGPPRSHATRGAMSYTGCRP